MTERGFKAGRYICLNLGISEGHGVVVYIIGIAHTVNLMWLFYMLATYCYYEITSLQLIALLSLQLTREYLKVCLPQDTP